METLKEYYEKNKYLESIYKIINDYKILYKESIDKDKLKNEILEIYNEFYKDLRINYMKQRFPTQDIINNSNIPKEIFDALNNCIIYNNYKYFSISDFNKEIYSRLNITYEDLFKLKYLKVLKYYKKQFRISQYYKGKEIYFAIISKICWDNQ